MCTGLLDVVLWLWQNCTVPDTDHLKVLKAVVRPSDVPLELAGPGASALLAIRL